MTSTSGISIKAVLVGVAIDIGGGMLAGVVFVTVYMGVLLSQGVSQADLQDRMLTDQSFYVVDVIIGEGFLAGGAFVAARIARAREVAHTGLVGVLGVLISAALAPGSGVDTTMYPSWYRPVLYGLALPVALLTGYVARRFAKPR
jgi:hypothetical protein